MPRNVVVILVLAFSLGLQGQKLGPDEIHARAWSYQPAPLTLRAGVASVPLEVVVRDKAGDPVAGLAQQNFRIFDQGQPQTIASFSMETHAAAPAAGAGTPGPTASAGVNTALRAAPPRYLALYFDDVNTTTSDLGNARIAADRFVRESLAPGDFGAIFTASGSPDVPFTTDDTQLLAAIAALRAHPRTTPESAGCLRITDYQAYLIANHLDPGALSAALQNEEACEKQIGNDQTTEAYSNNAQALLGGSEPSEIVAATANTIWTESRDASQDLLHSIGAAIAALAAQPGSRVLVLASGGFLAGTLEGEQDDIIQQALHAQATINSLDARGLYTEDPGPPLGDTLYLSRMRISPAMFQFSEESRASEGVERETAMANLALSTA